MRVVSFFAAILRSGFGWANTLVTQRVTVIDATGRSAQPGTTVVIEQDRIAAVGPLEKAKIPAGSAVVDGNGKFLIPGFWDTHVHEFASLRDDVTWT
jgi:imidazolonepropionase-like amidohydrolase